MNNTRPYTGHFKLFLDKRYLNEKVLAGNYDKHYVYFISNENFDIMFLFLTLVLSKFESVILMHHLNYIGYIHVIVLVRINGQICFRVLGL